MSNWKLTSGRYEQHIGNGRSRSILIGYVLLFSRFNTFTDRRLQQNPNNPDAGTSSNPFLRYKYLTSSLARKFHELNQAYELLLDPLRRLALDAKLRVKAAKAERFKSFDTKRKAFLEELEERERSFKKARMDKQKSEADQWQANEKIKDEGRRLREEKEKEIRQREQNAKKVDAEDEPPSIRTYIVSFSSWLSLTLLRTQRHDRPSQILTIWTSRPDYSRGPRRRIRAFRPNRHGYDRAFAESVQESPVEAAQVRYRSRSFQKDWRRVCCGVCQRPRGSRPERYRYHLGRREGTGNSGLVKEDGEAFCPTGRGT